MTNGARLQVQVLGPIRAVDGQGRDAIPVGTLQRRLFALLVLRRGHVVTVDGAVDVLWPDKAPRDPAAALHNHVFRLRRALPDGVVQSAGDGYRLDPARIELDADQLLAALNADPPTDAELATIDAALQRWQGPAYVELDDVDDGRAEAIRLDELRTRAREQRAARRLARGETDGVVAELVALTDEEPLRERPRALLMEALAAAGRHAEALRVFDDFRRLLGAELGIEPSPALAAQHAELLGAGGPAWALASRLPVPATSLIGRDSVAAEVTALAETCRLVTLVGPGGVGKTRLVIEVGHRLLAARADRPVVLCELAAADPTSAVDAVAAALRIDARPGTPLDERVAAVLADSGVVLLLDNCEHVLDPVARLVERLLASCPNVRVVATSRERLRVAGEQVCSVPTLAVGDEEPAAVQLFVERARAVAPRFEPDRTELACITEIVRRLDGLPLAIELAAARLHTHDVAEVAAGLDRRFSLLSAGYRTSSRHGSLGAAVSWSFGLLDEELRRIFSELSVFAGSFAAADAAAVCAGDLVTVTDALAQLVERSLVLRTPDRRYVLLETLRAFGGEQLVAAGRAEEVAGRHARHHVEWIEQLDGRILEPGAEVAAKVDAGIAELRSAFGWLVDHGQVELAGRMVAALLDYGILRLRPDVLAWAERVTAADPEDRSPLAPVVWVAASYAAWMAGDIDGSVARSRRALLAAERDGGPIPAEVSTVMGTGALVEGRLAEASALYRRGAAAATAAGDPAQQLMANASELLALGYAGEDTEARAAALLAQVGEEDTPYAAYVWYCAGEADLGTDVERARQRHLTALRLAERTNAAFVIGVAGASKASIDARFGDPDTAAADYRWLLPHWRRAGMWSTQWTMLRSIAGLLARLGRHHDAAVLEGAVRGTGAGHRIFGADEVALAELSAQLRAVLGDDAYEAARRQGAVLDGDAAVEHALRAL